MQKWFHIKRWQHDSFGFISEKHVSERTIVKLEAGTQPYAQAYALGRALDFLDEIGLDNIQKHEQELVISAYQKLSELPDVKILPKPKKRAGIISFSVDGLHAHDLVLFWIDTI